MPVMDGYEATKIIRQNNNDIPIIALTANAMKEDIEKTKDIGMNEHLNKPIDVQKLYFTLLKYISKKVISTDTLNNDNIEDTILPEFINIDINIGLSHMDKNKKLYIKILNDFYNNYSNLDLNLLNQDEFKRTLHTLKGLSANIGATKLYDLTKEIEETEDNSLVSKLEKELSLILNELENKIINQTKEVNITHLELTTSKRAELFTKLKEVIKSKRIKKCELIIQEIEGYQLSNEDKVLINKIKKSVNMYDFKNAIATMDIEI